MLLVWQALSTCSSWAQTTFTVNLRFTSDEKAIFATVETHDVVSARVRSGGTIERILVREGDAVTQGQLVATVADPKLDMQKAALDAQIAALDAQLALAVGDLDRAQRLFTAGYASRVRLDGATAAAAAARNQLKARIALRAVIAQQITEEQVLAPTTGRVLHVPVTAGSVVMPGEAVASVGEGTLFLRLRVPERHARFLKAGDPVRLDTGDPGQDAAGRGVIVLVYPSIQDGRVVADAQVAGLGDYFVGERVRVWISAGSRPAYVVPERFVLTRFGLDYVRQRRADGMLVEIPVQRGRETPATGIDRGLEILSGVQAGDVLVQP